MTIKTAIEHYRDGTATESERKLVEEELEKQQLLTQLLDSQWVEELPTASTEDTDFKKIKQSLRWRNIALVATSLALVIAILLGIWGKVSQEFTGMVDNANQQIAEQYPSPDTYTYCEYASDLQLTLLAYSELLHPGWKVDYLYTASSGLGSYQLTVRRQSSANGNVQYLGGSLEKGVLKLPYEFTNSNLPVNIFDRATYPYYSMSDDAKTNTYKRLQNLPEYIWVEAAISFPEDLSMEQLLELEANFGGDILWTAVRTSDPEEQRLPLCGMDVFTGGRLYDGVNGSYPCFDLYLENTTAENLQTHFKSLLRYSADRAADGTGIALTTSTSNDCYYETVLSYVEENGVYSYGCIVSAPAQELLALLDSDTVSQVWLLDAYMNI